MTTLTLDEAQQCLPDAVEKALNGEEVAIKVGRETVRLVHDVPIRPLGYFAASATPHITRAPSLRPIRILRLFHFRRRILPE